jgi:hypothetical protein
MSVALKPEQLRDLLLVVRKVVVEQYACGDAGHLQFNDYP